MKKTPSELKWLAGKRARFSGAIQETEHLLARVGAQIEAQRSALRVNETLEAALRTRLEAMHAALAGLDSSIRDHPAKLEPELIQPIHEWQGRYGKRGALRAAVMDVLKSVEPACVELHTLDALVAAKLCLVFAHVSERKRWTRNSFQGAVTALVRDGQAERLGEVGSPGHYRLMQIKTSTLKELREKAAGL